MAAGRFECVVYPWCIVGLVLMTRYNCMFFASVVCNADKGEGMLVKNRTFTLL